MISLLVSPSAIAKCLTSAFWISPFRATSTNVVTDKNNAHVPNVSLETVLTSIKNEPKPNNNADRRSAIVKMPELSQYLLVCNAVWLD